MSVTIERFTIFALLTILTAPSGAAQRGASTNTVEPRVRDALLALVDDSAWDLVEEDAVVELQLPSHLTDAEIANGLAELMLVEPSWSMQHVKRAVEAIAEVPDPIADSVLRSILFRARRIATLRSQWALEHMDRRDRRPYLNALVDDLRRSVREALAGRTR